MSARIMPSPILFLSRLILFLVVLVPISSPSTKAVCPVPQIPANSEFFKRDLVFTGTVLSVREWPDANDIGGWFYQVKVERVFRGAPRRQVEVFTENTSGRFPLEKNHEYLLFADRNANRFEIDNCGNSALLSEATDSLERLNNLLAGKQPTEIAGWVVGETDGVDLSGVRVTPKGRSRTFLATTDKNGRFQITVPPGRYRVVVDSKQYYLNNDDLFWYDADHFLLHRGECVVVQLVSARHSGR
jgi:hypothetical protein